MKPCLAKTRGLVTFTILTAGLFWLGRLAAISAEEVAKSQQTASESAPAAVATAPEAAKQLVAVAKNIPTSAADLSNLQAAIQHAVEKGLPATVGISIGNTFGSGVVVTEDGYILSAGHVVASARPGEIATITFADRKTVQAKTLGVNFNMDAGLLKITKDGKYPHVDMGRSADLKLGQWCVTLGHPNGLKPGRPPVVRAGRVWYSRDDAVGTDCAIVGGDSGGPLLDTDGRVIGIHSRISEGIIENFDVPIDTFRDNWDRLAKGEVWGGPDGPMLGVDGETDPQGCRVLRIYQGFPASRFRLERGDIITRLDNDAVTSMRSLRELIGKHQFGDEVTLSILRGDEKLDIKIKLDRPQ